MRMTTYRLERLLAAAAAVLTMALWSLPQGVQAQGDESFTLTNGRLWWYEGQTWGSGHLSEVAFDANDHWAKVLRYNSVYVTHVAQMGPVYLRLDISTPASPKIEAVDTSAFDKYCVWQRTGTTGYYYQLWDNYRYYLVGNPDELKIVRIATTEAISQTTYWYNWDYGAALTNIYYDINGDRKSSYHWVMYDDKNAAEGTLGEWTISNDAYQRPEDAIYRCLEPAVVDGRDTLIPRDVSADSITDAPFKTYYDNYRYQDAIGEWHNIPNGNGALVLPVTVTGYTKQIENIPDDRGLTNVAVHYNEADATSLRYGKTVRITPTIDVSGYLAQIRPAYTEYRQEVYRYGMHLNIDERKEEGVFSSAGIPTYRYDYYYDDAIHDALPATYSEALTVEKVSYKLNNSARRYLSLEFAEESASEFHVANVPDTMMISCVSVPPAGAVAKLTVTVTYTNGTTQSKTVDIQMSNHVDRRAMPYAEKAPVVHGSVVGGGRMANVGGNTHVTVHACDSIYAVYGGNDIAGWVQGDTGAVLTIGTAKTDKDHKVHIGYVYGGGCGKYTYRGINFGVDNNGDNVYPYSIGNTSLIYQCYYFNGEVYPWGYEPTLSPTAPAGTPHDPVTAADTAYLVWDQSDRVVDNRFVYDPLYSNPSDVDNNKTGDNGNGTVPYIKKSKITIGDGDTSHSNHILIDTLFGGAENAFIGVTATSPANASTIDVNGGVIYAVFGGNNYGGAVAKTATNIVNINATRQAPKPGDPNFDAFKANFEAATGLDYTGYNLGNTYFRGYGRDWGIRYVYGGGNLVECSHSEVNLLGGMVDTVFGGGNRATVEKPKTVVNCDAGNFIYENDSITREWVWKAAGTYDGEAHATGEVVRHPKPWTLGSSLVELEDRGARNLYDATNTGHEWAYYDSLVYHSPGRFRGGIGRYNVRMLFGGNNHAPMNTIARVTLTSGGIGSAYGGGNAGDMRYMGHWSNTADLKAGIKTCLGGWEYQWPEAISSIIHSPMPAEGGSHIVCENIYGGCRMANVRGTSALWLSSGVFGYVHGGNDISGDVGTETGEGSYVILDGEVTVLQDVYGGNDGFYHCHEQKAATSVNEKWGERYMDGGETLVDNTDVPYDPYDEYVGLLAPTQNSSNLYIHANVDGKRPTVLNAAYGGGVMTNVGFDNDGDINRIYLSDTAGFTGTVDAINYRDGERRLKLPGGAKKGEVHFMVNGGQIGSDKHLGDGSGDGNAYGGGYLSSTYGLCYAKVKGNSVIKGSLYAGNDCMGSISSFGDYQIPAAVYREWNAETETWENEETIHTAIAAGDFEASDGTSLHGGDGATHSAYLLIEDTPTINCVYGSGNGAYNYDGTRPEYSDREPVCQNQQVDNRPLQKSCFIDINTSGGYIDTVFGGGNGVGVSSDVVVLLNCTGADVEGVGIIFGGNNRDDMDGCVPDIRLKKGTVDYVFGGGNAGNMNGMKPVNSPYCGAKVDSVSTYVKVESEDVTVKEAIFGGCRKADVKYKAYVDIRNSNTADGKGINYVYGGNDISGTVYGNTRIDVSGGRVKHIYGGSNGRYDYDEMAANEYDVYTFGETHDAAHLIASGTTGRPFVDKTTLNLWGGIIEDNVYGGGRLGSCRQTLVNVNDRECTDPLTGDYHDLTINGSVYGGGEGYWEDLNAEHQGNVVATDDGAGYTRVLLYHASNLSSARAYGGGRGGDVDNTYIETFDTWDQPFAAIYGGCWGSTVHGTTHVVMRGNTEGESMTADSVFGGNDFTGFVTEANVRIESGKYGNIYGAGNGNYAEEKYTSGVYAGNFGSHDGATGYPRPKRLYVPNTQKVEINFEGGIVNYNLYGGGKMGTSFPYRRNSDGTLYYDLDGRLEADTLRTAITSAADYNADNLPFDDPTRYSYLVVNVKGGTIKDVYGGAAGSPTSGVLVYGLKMVNMQGGSVIDIYGGSENCSDGYWHECYAGVDAADYRSMSTKRPSSIVNMTGGTVESNIYGGGYLGNAFGSAYVNVGIDAVDSCEAWHDPVSGAATAYEVFRPGATGGLVDALEVDHVLIGNSIYGGANWGENSGSSDYTAEGFFGANNWIIVDGEGYNTYLDAEHETLKRMTVTANIIGSGTSAKGGDLKSRIDIRNYGAPASTDPSAATCTPGKELLSIQRASELWLHNTAIHYTGARDAVSAYTDMDYTINRIGKMNTMGYNILSVTKTISNIGEVSFYEEGWPLTPTDNNKFYRCVSPTYRSEPDCPACESTGTVCQQLSMIDRDESSRKLTAILMYNGINIDFIDEDDNYSKVNGYAYIMAEPGTNAVVTARPKYGLTNSLDGGFMPACGDSLQYIQSENGTLLTWEKDTSRSRNAEYPYYNYSTQYRVWSLGNGSRIRFAVVKAHSDPKNEGVDNKPFTIGGNNYSMAKSTLKLPPTAAGRYYKINGGIGVEINDENEEMRMTDQAYIPHDKTWDEMDDTWHPDDDPGNNATEHTEEPNMRLVTEASPTRNVALVLGNPGSYFGMAIIPGENFKKVDNKLVKPKTADSWDSCTVINGNEHVNSWNNFASAQVSDNTNSMPEIDIYVTYGNTFNHTIVGYVTFTLDEYIAVPKRVNYNGDGTNAPYLTGQYNRGDVYDDDPSTPGIDTVWLDSNLNTPINVQVTIATILEDFGDMSNNVLAMYNEGRTNIFSRKIVLPATLEGRELYLTKVAWAPTTKDGSSAHGAGNGDWALASETPNWFELTSDSASIIGTGNRFRMTIKPSDNITNSMTTASGWHTRNVQAPLDLVTAVGQSGAHQYSAGNYYTPEDATVPGDYGRLIGELDGHGEAALDVNLNFDGNHVYDDVAGKGYIGKVVMTFKSYKGSAAAAASDPTLARHEFTITIYVKTRSIGDTIYVASSESITRGSATYRTTYGPLYGHDLTYYAEKIGSGEGYLFEDETDFKNNCGKSPSLYLTNIKEAFNERIYEEGDVICILDQVNITQPLLIKGNDYMDVPVVRYDGHHHDLPGEEGVYRNTMLNVSGAGASFSARFISFRGGLLSKIEPASGETGYNSTTYAWTDHDTVYNPIPNAKDNARGKQKYADTNIVYGPIIAVNNGGTVALQNGVSVEQNYNGYTGDDLTKYGAINVDANSRLTMVNNVTILHNLSDTIVESNYLHNTTDGSPYRDADNVAWRIHPYNGAVVVNGGRVDLLASSSTTAMTITDNYVCGSNLGRFYTKYEKEYDSKNRLLRYDFYDNPNAVKANVLLARQPNRELAAAQQDTSDSQSEMLFFSSTLPGGTRIGISKWFPDENEELRDTIQIVFQSSGTHLAEANENGNFVSDNGYYVMYNDGVNVQRIYLQRCATFRHQKVGVPVLAGSSISPKNVLNYKCMANVNCPTGGDTIVYRVQGGFFPYTYSWSGENSRERTTGYTSNEIKKQIGNGNYNGFKDAIADTLITSNISLESREMKKNISFRAQATDASGNCTLHKDIYITLEKSIEDNPLTFDSLKYDDLTTYNGSDIDPNSWSDTNSSNPALATRQYKTVQITPKVWANPYSGIIQSVLYNSEKNTYSVYLDDGIGSETSLSNVYFCEGEIIKLTTTPKYTAGEPVANFVMWDFDPYYSPSATFVVPTQNRDVVAYYSPLDYWKDHVDEAAKAGAAYDNNYTYTGRPTVAAYTLLPDGSSTTKAGYVTTYNGDVHIYNENGLAWFISVVNGLNGTQAREFFFNKVYLHDKSGGYDMKDYLWSPVGNRQHAFRGWFQGVSDTENDTTRLADDSYVTIKNIILNEPEMSNVGMFGFLDSAHVYSIKLSGAMIRGNEYVGALAANSTHTKVKNCIVEGNDEGESVNTTTILTTHYVSGGMIGQSDHDRVTNSTVSAKYVGDAVYSGGVIGYGTSSTIANSGTRNDTRMSGLYVGGIAGYLTGTAPVNRGLFRKAKSGDLSEVRNNYVYVESDGKSQRVGGIVGQSSNTVIENNYVYGLVSGSATDGAVGAVLNGGTRADNIYYQNGSAKRVSGQTASNASVGTTATFEGSGNRVKIDQQVYGVDNLTRVLNLWVNEHNEAEGSGVYKTWRSDLAGTNHGYPIFGDPDMIPVESRLTLENCDSVEWEGVYYTADTTVSYSIVDSVLMVDSTTALTVIVHHSTTTALSDTTGEGEGYAGYGFYLTPAETRLMHNTLDSTGAVTIVLSDTLATSYGCDSIVTLSLTITANVGVTEVTPVSTVKVYPNPTTSHVTVEAGGLKHVELYDNEGRRLADYSDAAGDKLTIDLDRLSTGVYYLRIHTGERVTIQKVIKK